MPCGNGDDDAGEADVCTVICFEKDLLIKVKPKIEKSRN